MTFLGGLLRKRPEDPRRMSQFRDSLKDLQWIDDKVIASLSKLFDAVDDLATHEVQYYYRRRQTRAWISGLSRFAAWVAGTIGLLVPLLAAPDGSAFKFLSPYGYAFLALSASLLAANALFGGTSGHVRFVSTQLELEKLITSSRIAWLGYLASKPGPANSNSITGGFKLVNDYAQGLYLATIAETGRWGETLLAELDKYQKRQEEKKGQTSE